MQYDPIRKEDLKSYQQGQGQNDDFRFARLRKCIKYSSEVDEVIAAMSEQQIEKLAMSLVGAVLLDPLNPDLLANSKLQRLLKYVQHVSVNPDRFSLDQLQLLAGIVPGLVSLHATRNRDRDSNEFNDPWILFIPFSLAIQFKGIKSLCIDGKQTSPAELGQILDACRFLCKLRVYSGEFELTFNTTIDFEKEIYWYHFNESMMYRVLHTDYSSEAASLHSLSEVYKFFNDKELCLYAKEQVIGFLLRYDFLRID